MGDSGIEIGAVLAGKYRVERVLGKGGMGIVVQAMHLQLDQPVAMKFLLPELLGDNHVVQRFLREAQAAVRLRSEHVARVIDVGSLDTGAPYMVLEYLEGADLSRFPRSQLAVGAVIDLVLQACEALAEAHALGIVHRDIKPGNFFITRGSDGALLLKILDFGISKIPTGSGQLTASQTVIGTPVYMSPEQMRSPRDVDHRSDIWSLGVVLYELLQGSPPFGDEALLAMAIKVVNDPLPKLTVRLPGDLDEIIYRCLEKNPARRFQTVAELAHAISKYAQSETQAAISVQRTKNIAATATPRVALEPTPARHARISTISGSVTARTVALQKRRRPILAAVGAKLGLIVVAIIVLAIAGSRLGGGPQGSLPREPAERTPAAVPDGHRHSTGASWQPAGPPEPVAPASVTAVTPAQVMPMPPVTAPASAPPPATTPAPAPVATTRAAGPAPPRPDAPAPAARIVRQGPAAASPASPRVSSPTSPAPRNAKKQAKASVVPVKPEIAPVKQPTDEALLDIRH